MATVVVAAAPEPGIGLALRERRRQADWQMLFASRDAIHKY
jgi:hypothetical protein